MSECRNVYDGEKSCHKGIDLILGFGRTVVHIRATGLVSNKNERL